MDTDPRRPRPIAWRTKEGDGQLADPQLGPSVGDQIAHLGGPAPGGRVARWRTRRLRGRVGGDAPGGKRSEPRCDRGRPVAVIPWRRAGSVATALEAKGGAGRCWVDVERKAPRAGRLQVVVGGHVGRTKVVRIDGVVWRDRQRVEQRAAVNARRAAVPPLKPRLRPKGHGKDVGAARRHAAEEGAVGSRRAVDRRLDGPARDAQVNGRAGGGADRDGGVVAERVRRVDLDRRAGRELGGRGRPHRDDDAAVGGGVEERVGELWPALVEVCRAAAEVWLEAVRLGEGVVVLPDVRARLDCVDLVDRLEVLVRPHVAPRRRGPSGGEGVVGDALRTVGKGECPVDGVHRLVRVHRLDDATQLDAARGGARVRDGSNLVAEVHPRGLAVRRVELAHAAERELRHGEVGVRRRRVEAPPHRRRLEALRHVDVVVRRAGDGLEPAVPVLALRLEQRDELEELASLSVGQPCVVDQPLCRLGHVDPARLRPAGKRSFGHPPPLLQKVQQHGARRLRESGRVALPLRLGPLPERLQYV
mmetsp:Transcript_40208/g.133082  ORF Transcript_40208/g.133082 Transcript_40208/m.133082 type:complete len:532 (+) Transcript_40208:131-1726(+)